MFSSFLRDQKNSDNKIFLNAIKIKVFLNTFYFLGSIKNWKELNQLYYINKNGAKLQRRDEYGYISDVIIGYVMYP